MKVELRTEAGELLQAEIPQDDHHRLALGRAEDVWVSPRQSRSFEPSQDYAI